MRFARAGWLIVAACLALATQAQAQNWGLEVGRATTEDAVELAQDKVLLRMSEARFRHIVTSDVLVERQKQLLGEQGSLSPAELERRISDWWLENVVLPAKAIATNPAATCVEALMGIKRYLSLERQRQLLGASDADHPTDTDKRLSAVYDELLPLTMQRCHEEALDECVATGRFVAVYQQALGEERQSQLLGAGGTDTSWVDDALKQCAIYELRFKSVGSLMPVGQMAGYERVIEGSIRLEYVPGKSLLEKGTFTGKTDSGTNPWLTSIKCSQPTNAGVLPYNKLTLRACGPGGTPGEGAEAEIELLDLKHPVFELDENEVVKVTYAGTDHLAFQFFPGPLEVPFLLRWLHFHPPLPSTDFVQNTDVFLSHYGCAHRAERTIGTVPIEGHEAERKGHPKMFEVTLTDRGASGELVCVDSTTFELIHKPEPAPYAPNPNRPLQPKRTPLKPAAP